MTNIVMFLVGVGIGYLLRDIFGPFLPRWWKRLRLMRLSKPMQRTILDVIVLITFVALIIVELQGVHQRNTEERRSTCTAKLFEKNLAAVGERVGAAKTANDALHNVLTAELTMWQTVIDPKVSRDAKLAAFTKYLVVLSKYDAAYRLNAAIQYVNPIPTAADVRKCLGS